MTLRTHKFFLLALALVGTYLLAPFASDASPAGTVLSLGWNGCMAACVYAPGATARRRHIALGLFAAITLLEFLSLWQVHLIADSVQGALSIALLFLAVFTLFRDLLRAERVGSEQICASIVLYLLIGIFYWVLYGLLARYELSPPAFHGVDPRPDAIVSIGERRSFDLLYFSFVSLTTVGYGDIVPVHPFARTLATLEAVTGQLYLALLVARLVSLQFTTPPSRAS
jgi:hypothetical protein